MHERVLADRQAALGEQRVVGGREHLGEPTGGVPVDACGHGQGGPLVEDRLLGLPPAAHDRHDPVADREALGGRPHRHDLARELEPRDVGRAPGRGGVVAASLEHVGPVHARRPDVDQDLAGAGLGIGVLPPLEPAVHDRHRPHGPEL